MYEGKINMSANLFPTLDLSEDAQKLLSAGVIGSAGKGAMNFAGRMSGGIVRGALKVAGAAAVLYGVNEAVEVVTGVDVASILFNAACDGVNTIRDYVDERRAAGVPEPVNIVEDDPSDSEE